MKRTIDFLKLRFIMIAVSLVLIGAGLAGYFVRGGFNFGIDYSAGLVEQVQIARGAKPVTIADLRQALAGLAGVHLQAVGNPANQEFTIKVIAAQEDPGFQSRVEEQISAALGSAFGSENVEVLATDFVGPRYSRELVGQTVSIVLVAMVLILIYTAFRFKISYATAAVLCLVHDTLFMLGVIATFQIEMTTTTIAAVMTIIGYSLNDTIVIFDRVRENQSLMRDADLATILNTSISQSLGRTFLTSFTTLLAVVMIFIFGTGDIKNFALNLIVGVVVGTYSTVFIASPIVLAWSQSVDKRRRRRDLQLYGRQAAAQAAPGVGERREEAREVLPGAAVARKPSEEKAADSGPRAAVQVTRMQPSRRKKKKKKH